MTYGRFNSPLEGVLTGVMELFRRKTSIRPINDQDRLDGKTVVVTGSNSGVGFAVAIEMAKRGANLIMACRSGIPEKGEEVKELSGSDQVRMEKIDLSDAASIHAFCGRLKEQDVQIDIIICNAGVATPGSRKTKQGVDEMFMVNYLSKYVLLNRLLRDGTIPNAVFGNNAKMGERPRIIFTSSDSHQKASPIDFDTLGVYEAYGVSKGIGNYSYFKLVLNTFVTELSRRLNPNDQVDVSVHAICPGPVATNIARDAPPALKGLLKIIFRFFFLRPDQSTPPFIYFAAGTEVEGQTNLYLHMTNQKAMDEKCYLPEEGKKLWEKTVKLADGLTVSSQP